MMACVVEQGEGDSVVGAFARASDAVAAAVDAQMRFHAESWPAGMHLRVRMAVHTGETELRDEGNYFGPAIIRCARLRSIAGGGQVLVSGATADLVRGRLRTDASLVDRGLHRLKDLGRPERVFEVHHPAIPAYDAPLRSLDNLPNNLPVQLTTFVGRGDELSALRALITTTRLLSVIGAGGCGKTRLAIQLAADVVDEYSGGTWLVELATVTDPGRVAATIATALGERDLGGDLVEGIAIRIGDRPTLVVLDNCEHVLDAAADLSDTLLRRCESLTLIVTSREPLGVPGETAWRVPSMATPAPTEPLQSLEHFDAVRLFVDRAKKARPNFALTDENAVVVAQICHRLEGIPLAVELAAARVRGLPVEHIAAGLDDRFRLLTGGARTVLPRQQTLQASVDWSYDLLSERERAAFRRLSVFAGGFTLDAAEEVVAGGDIAPVEVLDLLVALVDKSMVDIDDERSRYRMLESLRQYAAARLVNGGETTAARDAHLAWAAESIDPIDVVASDALDWFAPFADDIENMRAAFEWAVATGDAERATRCLAPLGRWEVSHGDPRAGIDVAIRALEMPGAPHHLRCLARASLAYAYAEFGEPELAQHEIKQLVPDLDDLDEEDEAVRSVCLLAAGGALQMVLGFEPSISLLQAALASAERAGHADAQHQACSLLAMSLILAGDWDLGEAYAARVPAYPSSQASVTVDSARQYEAWARGRFDDALALLDGLPNGLSPRYDGQRVLVRLQLDMAMGTDSGAAERLDMLIDQARRRGFHGAIALFGWAPGAWRMLHGEPEAGAEAMVAWQAETQSRWGSFVSWALLTLGRYGDARAQLERERVSAWGAEAIAMNMTTEALLARFEGDTAGAEQRGHEALVAHHRSGFRREMVHSLEALAGLASVHGSYVECARLAGAAQALRDEMRYVLRWPFEETLRDADLGNARIALGDEAFDAAFAEGRTLDEEAAVEYAQRARGERKRPTVGWNSLTPTEANVVRLVAAGMTNKEIAQELLMGSETVKTHLSHVYDKVGVRNRAALATEFASRAGDL